MSDEHTTKPTEDEQPDQEPQLKGPLAWFAKNSVAANVIMVIILGAGLFLGTRVRQEVFPEVVLDMVMVQVPYPGATPDEVESGVVLATEEAVRSLDGVKRVTSYANEGSALVLVEIESGEDASRVLNDVDSAVGRIASYPEGIERPTVSLATNEFRQVSLVVSGKESEQTLRALAESLRGELLNDKRITKIELGGRAPEISIDVRPEMLQRYGVTLDAIAGAIRAASVEIPGGVVRTRGGEILLRTSERRVRASELEEIVVLSNPDGSQVKLSEIATVRDTFADVIDETTFDGERAVLLNVYRTGDETPMDVSAAVAAFVEKKKESLPEGIALTAYADNSEMYQDRRDLMLKNAGIGLVLVLLVLGLFLEMRLAFWVTLGIPISFVGALIVMPAAGASINMISLFAFIVVLGMVVDDAIVIGEAIHRRRQQGMSAIRATLAGLREVAMPVVFAVTTTIVAFAPMLFLPGFMGQFFRIIPIVVISVLTISLIESLFILPAHLAHSKPPATRGVFGWITRQQQRFGRGLEWLIEKTYLPTLRGAVKHRYITLAAAVALLIASVGLVAGGRVSFTFFPKVEGDFTTATVTLPTGAPVEDTRDIHNRLIEAAQKTLVELGDEDDSRGILASVGSLAFQQGPLQVGAGGSSSMTQVGVYLVPLDDRPFTAAEFTKRWRANLGELRGVESLRFSYDTSGSSDRAIQLDLSHTNSDTLNAAAADLAKRMETFEGVFDVDDGYSRGKEQLEFHLKPAAKRLGITEAELARQVRASFFGAEALRIQRGRDEVRAYVRYPLEHRRSEHDIESLLIRTPAGGDVPLPVVATIERGFADTQIVRRDGRRVASVSADVDEASANANTVVGKIISEHIPELQKDYPGLTYSFGGMQETQAETMSALGANYIIALIAIFALLAIAFRSYIQPLIIMTAIPFGIVGAILGHFVMGFDFSIMSMLGITALSGVVVNDSLILIVAINKYRNAGFSAADAVQLGGRRRFRPILLTSLTTFFGLAPMLLETSVQARFLVPMAVSLAFGIIVSTGLLLVLVPALYMILEDAKAAFAKVMRFLRTGSTDDSADDDAGSSDDDREAALAKLVNTGDFARDQLLGR